MKLFNQVLLIALMGIILQGCQLGTDDEDDDDEIYSFTINTEYYDTDDDDDVTSEYTYKLILQATANYADILAEDDIIEIKIYGNSNEIEIDSDTSIDEIAIFGDGNIITVNANVDLTVSQLTISGDNNSVTVFDVTTYTDSGLSNFAYEGNGATSL